MKKGKKNSTSTVAWEPLDKRNAIAIRFTNDEAFRKAAFIVAGVIERYEVHFPGFHTIILDQKLESLFATLKGSYILDEVAQPGEVSEDDLRALRRLVKG